MFLMQAREDPWSVDLPFKKEEGACNDQAQHTMLEMPRDVRYAAAWAGSTCRLVYDSVNACSAHGIQQS